MEREKEKEKDRKGVNDLNRVWDTEKKHKRKNR